MNFKFNHNNLNVRDLEKSIQFYKDALGLTVVREKDAADGSFKLVYLSDGRSYGNVDFGRTIIKLRIVDDGQRRDKRRF